MDGIASAHTESRRYAPPPLRFGPSGDTVFASAEWHLWPASGQDLQAESANSGRSPTVPRAQAPPLQGLKTTNTKLVLLLGRSDIHTKPGSAASICSSPFERTVTNARGLAVWLILLFGHQVMRIIISPVESSPPVFAEGAEPDVLSGFGEELVAVVVAVALGGADAGPARAL